MADFCTKCAKEHGFPKPDIDVKHTFDSLKLGYFKQIGVCEGCGMLGISKTEDGKMQIAFADKQFWVNAKINDYE